MNNEDNYEKSINQITNTLNHITTFLNEFNYEENDENFFKNSIELYGIINYSRSQFFPKTSSFITDNHAFNDIFFNYTSAESMILDLFVIIESDLIRSLDENNPEKINHEKINTIIDFSNKILLILDDIINTRINLNNKIITQEKYESLNRQYTTKLFNIQNEFYSIVYDEKVDFRVK